MKLNKKFLSCFMAATMVATPFTAFAADGDVAGGEITGSGNVTYLNTEIYNVILPTSDAINFYVDPYGLLQIDANGDALDNVTSGNAGGVTSKATAVINKSSVPINVGIEVNVYNNIGATSAAIALTDDASNVGKASTASDAGLCLQVVEYSGAVTPAAAFLTGAAGTTVTFDDELEATEAALLLSTASLEIYRPTISTATAIKAESNGQNSDVSGTSINFKLDGMPSAYNVLSTGAVTLNETSASALICTDSAVALSANVVKVLTIEGTCDKESKVWKQFTGAGATQDLKLSMKFVITSGKAETETETETATEITTLGYNTTSKAFWITIPNVTTADRSLISDVKVSQNGTSHDVSTYSTTNASLMINWSAISTNVSWPSATTPLTFTFNYDGTAYTATYPVE